MSSGPIALFFGAAKRWMTSRRALGIVVSVYVLSVAPLWIGNFLDPRTAAARIDFDPMGILEPVAGRLPIEVFARLQYSLMVIPSVRPVFGPGPTPTPAELWTPAVTSAVSLAAWVLGLALLPFFIRGVAGLGGDSAGSGGLGVAARTVLARFGVSLAAAIPTYMAFNLLPRLVSSPGAAGSATFHIAQDAFDMLSIVPVLLLFLWPYACAVNGLTLGRGAAWTLKAWRRAAPTILAILAIAVAARFLPPVLLAGAKAAGSLHWGLRLALRSLGIAFRFWLDATVCASWALLALRLGPDVRTDGVRPALEHQRWFRGG